MFVIRFICVFFILINFIEYGQTQEHFENSSSIQIKQTTSRVLTKQNAFFSDLDISDDFLFKRQAVLPVLILKKVNIEYQSLDRLMIEQILCSDPLGTQSFAKNTNGHIVTDNCFLYVSSDNEAIRFLKIIQQMRQNLPCSEQISFIFCLPLSITPISQSFENHEKIRKTVILMNRAQGTSLYEYIKNNRNHQKLLKILFMDLGKNLGKFQTHNSEKTGSHYSTAAHSNFSGKNVFCFLKALDLKEKDLWSFSLINCQNMKMKNSSFIEDPLYFLFDVIKFCCEEFHFLNEKIICLVRQFYKGYKQNLTEEVSRFVHTLLFKGLEEYQVRQRYKYIISKSLKSFSPY